MNVGFSGCSFTYGNELQNPITSRYSAIVSKELGINEYNVSQNAISIDLIHKNMYELTKKVKLDFAVIQLTLYSRFSYAYEKGYKTINPFQKKFVGNQDKNFNLFVYSADTDYSLWYELQRSEEHTSELQSH